MTGEHLGCPDCIGGEPHCCPFIWADQQPEPKRTKALRHLRAVLADEIAVAAEDGGTA